SRRSYLRPWRGRRAPARDGARRPARRWTARAGARLEGSAAGPAGARAAGRGRAPAPPAPPPPPTPPATPPAPARPGRARATSRREPPVRPLLSHVAAAVPDAQGEGWVRDEHRLGLQPLLRRVGAPMGHRPVAVVRHRCRWR